MMMMFANPFRAMKVYATTCTICVEIIWPLITVFTYYIGFDIRLHFFSEQQTKPQKLIRVDKKFIGLAKLITFLQLPRTHIFYYQVFSLTISYIVG